MEPKPDHWIETRDTSDLERRFNNLSQRQQLMFVLGCLKHAADRQKILEQNSRTESAHEIIEDIWRQIDDIDADAILQRSQHAYDLCADAAEDAAGVPGEGPLLDGLFYALGGFHDQSDVNPTSAADQAYQLTVSLEFPNFTGFGDQLDQLARSSDNCVNELVFQLNLLNYLELNDGPIQFDALLVALEEWGDRSNGNTQ